MAYFKPRKEPYMTAGDRERIRLMDENPYAKMRKCKYLLTLAKKGVNQEVCIYVYGEDKDEIKAKADEELEFFRKSDKNWKIVSLVDCRAVDDDELGENA